MTKDSTALDRQLRDLALLAQQHPHASKERQIALTKLLNAIWQSGKLCRPHSGQFQLLYEDIYEEAVQNLFFYLCRDDNIQKYEPERGSFITWVNVLLTKRFFVEAIPKIVGQVQEINLEKSHLENVPSSESTSLLEQVIECIESDPEKLFINEHIKGHPEANFQAIARRRYSGIPWKDISVEWGIGITSLHHFYQRCVKKFAPYIRNYM